MNDKSTMILGCAMICLMGLAVIYGQIHNPVQERKIFSDSTSIYRSLYYKCNGTIQRANRDSSYYLKQTK